jgi:hypothetical protein
VIVGIIVAELATWSAIASHGALVRNMFGNNNQ